MGMLWEKKTGRRMAVEQYGGGAGGKGAEAERVQWAMKRGGGRVGKEVPQTAVKRNGY
ncbi:hypothetical protein LJC20_00730 [Eubacteriales bacterium OttesenSCG-928-M02]|nr:hypothetical protein [Eubacteriales bacterium OttesenSCG-928-M02]